MLTGPTFKFKILLHYLLHLYSFDGSALNQQELNPVVLSPHSAGHLV